MTTLREISAALIIALSMMIEYIGSGKIALDEDRLVLDESTKLNVVKEQQT